MMNPEGLAEGKLAPIFIFPANLNNLNTSISVSGKNIATLLWLPAIWHFFWGFEYIIFFFSYDKCMSQVKGFMFCSYMTAITP
jgi:hypothetical protein